MSRLIWDKTDERFFETGVSSVVLYPREKVTSTQTKPYPVGVAWSGVTGITNTPSGAETNDYYADNIKYLSIVGAEEFGATIGAYQSPNEFAECDGSKEIAPGVYVGQQARKKFGLAYKTILGNDTEGIDYAYKLHIVWNALAEPSEADYQTVNESVEPGSLSWSVSTTKEPVTVTDSNGKVLKPISHLEIRSDKTDAAKLKSLEDILFGVDGTSETTYNKVTPIGSENPQDEGWYELSGGSYVASTDTSIESGKTYYIAVPPTAGSEPWLPTPDEVLSLLMA